MGTKTPPVLTFVTLALIQAGCTGAPSTHAPTICEANLSEAKMSCPATWDAVDPKAPCSECRFFIGQRGDVRAFFADCNPLGNGGRGCFYDPTSGALQGVWLLSDVPMFCGNSFDQFAGSAKPELVADLETVAQRNCPATN